MYIHAYLRIYVYTEENGKMSMIMHIKCIKWFPGRLVVRTRCFHNWGLRSISGWGTNIAQTTRHSQKRKKKMYKMRNYLYLPLNVFVSQHISVYFYVFIFGFLLLIQTSSLILLIAEQSLGVIVTSTGEYALKKLKSYNIRFDLCYCIFDLFLMNIIFPFCKRKYNASFHF